MQTPRDLNSAILHDAQQRRWLHFHSPIQILAAHRLADVLPLLETVQQRVEQEGIYGVGWISYEASPAFDPSLVAHPPDRFPLAWFGLYCSPQEIQLPGAPEPGVVLDWQPSIRPDHYRAALRRVKQAIARGDTYQVNFSFRLRTEFRADPWAYFLQLMQAQDSSYGAFLQLPDWAICCASPELFFQWQSPSLVSRPMKGTAPRGLTYEGDRQLAAALHRSEKDRAENLMIVDMIRNDLGRIADLGTVHVPRLFDVEQYPTVWQMTSPVECTTSASLVEIVRALFPCASITGAPKASTMQIIADLERSPRRIYTGSIGFVAPGRSAQFNVAIRTVLIDRRHQTAEYGVGGGIVWDSVDSREYEECCTKARVLTQTLPSFELLESLLWTPAQGYFLWEAHLQRLQQSAEYFAFRWDGAAVRRELEAIAQTLPADAHKVRLRLSRQGDRQIQAERLTPLDASHPRRVRLAPTPIDASNPFLYHKTTHRRIYEQARQSHPDCDDVLLWNQRGELTESCIANVMVEWQGQWYTPPVSCGLLAGTFRALLLQQGKVRERVIPVEVLSQCTQIVLINSVRQRQVAVLV